jgi:hypothetical protein
MTSDLQIGGTGQAGDLIWKAAGAELLRLDESEGRVNVPEMRATNASGSPTDVQFSMGTGNDHGLYSASSAAVGISVAGVEVLELTQALSVFNEDGLDTNFRVESDGYTHTMFIDAGLSYVAINSPTPATPLDVTQRSSTGAVAVLELDQDDIDESFINFVGNTQAAGTRSISSDTTEDSAKFGAIRIEINGVEKWIRVYDDHS